MTRPSTDQDVADLVAIARQLDHAQCREVIEYAETLTPEYWGWLRAETDRLLDDLLDTDRPAPVGSSRDMIDVYHPSKALRSDEGKL